MRILPVLEAGSIGIIGGADGPTAVFVASRVSPWVYLAGGAAVLLLVVLSGAALFIHHRNRTK